MREGLGGKYAGFVWRQSTAELELRLLVPPGTRGRDVTVRFEPRHLFVAVGDGGMPLVDHELPCVCGFVPYSHCATAYCLPLNALADDIASLRAVRLRTCLLPYPTPTILLRRIGLLVQSRAPLSCSHVVGTTSITMETVCHCPNTLTAVGALCSDKVYVGGNSDDKGSYWELEDGRLLTLHLTKWRRMWVSSRLLALPRHHCRLLVVVVNL